MACKHREKDNCKKDGRPCIHNSDCFEPIPITNADRLRAMNDEELANWGFTQIGIGTDFFPCGVICGCKCKTYVDEECRAKILEWLKQPADEERDKDAKD